MTKDVDRTLSDYTAGKFREQGGPALEESGWELTLPSGRTVKRSFLQYQAEPLVELGLDAVEPLIRWVDRTGDPGVRYIVIYALERLTGRHPAIGYREAPDAEAVRKAADEWRAGARERSRKPPG